MCPSSLTRYYLVTRYKARSHIHSTKEKQVAMAQESQRKSGEDHDPLTLEIVGVPHGRGTVTIWLAGLNLKKTI
jgi:hypothetical protein